MSAKTQMLSTLIQVSVEVPDGLTVVQCREIMRAVLLAQIGDGSCLEITVGINRRAIPLDVVDHPLLKATPQKAADAALAGLAARANEPGCGGSAQGLDRVILDPSHAPSDCALNCEALGVSVDSSADSATPTAQPQPEGSVG